MFPKPTSLLLQDREVRELFPGLTLFLLLQDKEVGEFVSRANSFFANRGQREEVGKTQADLLYFCAFNASSWLPDYHLASPIGIHNVLAAAALKLLEFVQRLKFSVKGGKVTALFRVIIVMTSAEDLKRGKEGVF